MKYFILLIISFSFLHSKEQEGPKPGSLEWIILQQKITRAYKRAAIPYFKEKYEKLAKEKLRELDRNKTRYEAGLAKLTKGTKRYKARESEFKDILNKIKAQKIILIYAKQFTAQLDAYDSKDNQKHIKQKTICEGLRDKYSEYTGEKFPNFIEEYKIIRSKKKGSKKTTKKRTASTQ